MWRTDSKWRTVVTCNAWNFTRRDATRDGPHLVTWPSFANLHCNCKWSWIFLLFKENIFLVKYHTFHLILHLFQGRYFSWHIILFSLSSQNLRIVVAYGSSKRLILRRKRISFNIYGLSLLRCWRKRKGNKSQFYFVKIWNTVWQLIADSFSIQKHKMAGKLIRANGNLIQRFFHPLLVANYG